MRRTLMAVVALALVAGMATGGGGGKKDDGKKDKEKLQGTWNVTAFEGGGKMKEVKAGEMALTFSGDKVLIKVGPKAKDEEATFRLDLTQNPRGIDLMRAVEAKEKAAGKETEKGIYQLKGDTLKLGFSARGARGKRPPSFEAADLVIMHLKRQGKS
jgi:uncharacterized protein (TIGR03067 family)